jgi:dienelactone hydrolase
MGGVSAGVLFSRLIAALAALILSACQGLESRPDIELTWQNAVVALPPSRGGEEPFIGRLSDSGVLARVASYPAGTKLATVFYLHGCTGLGKFKFFRTLARAGYAVIAPDSMARRFRPLQCDPGTRTGGFNLFVYDFRLTEISFGLNRVHRLPWVDRNNLFLIGISEGGVAAALYRGDEFRARVIAQWTCSGASIIEGLGAPPDEPVLAIVHADDPWYDPQQTNLQKGDCGAFFGARPGSNSYVLSGGAQHDIFTTEQSLNAILDFLKRNRAP